MRTALGPETATWHREVRRLRFSNVEKEQRFRRERIWESVTRSRVMLVVAILSTVAMGLVDTAANVNLQPDFVGYSMGLRVGVVAPIWLLMWIAPSLPHFERMARWLYPVGTIGVIWAVSMLLWFFQFNNPQQNVVPVLFVNVLAVGLVTIFTLPIFIRGTLLMLSVGLGGVVVIFRSTLWTENDSNTVTLAGGFMGFGIVMAAMAWNREVAARRDFAQREEVSALNRELARMNAEKNEFMAAAAHDLRSPLAAVRGLAGQLRLNRIADEERRTKALSAIDDLSGRMLEVVNNYLGEHALESGTLPVRLERLDLRKVIAEAAARHGPAAATKEQQVRAPAGAALWARADASLLGQVLDNFLSNALKFSPRGATVQLALATAGARVRVEVIDAGPGVSSEDRGKLFRKYSQTAARPTAGESSHGIGLAVVKRVAEAMGGEVGCDSEPGEGATFWIALPTS